MSGLSRRQVASDLGIGFLTLSQWMQKSPRDDLPATADLDLAKEIERLRENCLKFRFSYSTDTIHSRSKRLRKAKRIPSNLVALTRGFPEINAANIHSNVGVGVIALKKIVCETVRRSCAGSAARLSRPSACPVLPGQMVVRLPPERFSQPWQKHRR